MAEMTTSQTAATESPLDKLGFNRLNLVLLAVLVVQLVVIAILYWPSQNAPESGVPLLGELETSDITALMLTNNSGEQLGIEKVEGSWALMGTDGYPVTETKINETLDQLVAIASDRLVTRTSGSHERLQVADDTFNAKAEITTADGIRTLYIGSAPSSGATHVRLEGQNEAYLTNQISSWELNTTASSWIDTLYFSVERDSVVGITLNNANGELVFEKTAGDGEEDSGTWTLSGLEEGEELDTSTVSTLLSRVNSIRMVEPLGKTAQPDFGLDAPQATILLTTRDAEGNENSYALEYGAKDEENNNYYIKASNSDYYVTIAAFNGDELVNNTREDFLKEPEEEEASDSEFEIPALNVDATETESDAAPNTDQAIDTETITDTETTDENAESNSEADSADSE